MRAIIQILGVWPDRRYVAYFAECQKRPVPFYTDVSRPPYLTALQAAANLLSFMCRIEYNIRVVQSPRGTWINFDDATLVAEMRTIPQPDRGQLFFAMDRYAKGDAAGFIVKDYGDGLCMLKKNRQSGRSLFFTFEEKDGQRKLVLLLAYKKESQEAPDHLVEAARERRGRYIAARQKE